MMRRSLQYAAGILMILALVVAGTASAKTFSMSGQWYMNRGPLVDIPINGGPVLCIGGGADTGCQGNLKPKDGGVPGVGVANVTGGGPATFTLQYQVFGQSRATPTTVPVTLIGQVQQLQSQFTLAGPGSVAALPSLTNATEQAALNPKFMRNAFSRDPGQAARPAANFSFTSGPALVKVKYTAGQNAFGGTMAMMLKGTAVVSIPNGAQLINQLVGGTSNPTFGPQHPGRGYGVTSIDALDGGPVYSTFMFGNSPTGCENLPGEEFDPPGCEIVTQVGNQVGTGDPDVNINIGFPWTTGTVTAQALATVAGDVPTTLTAMGTDSRNVMGHGRITMVAGGTSFRSQSGFRFAALDIVNLQLSTITETPTLSPPAIAAAVSLLLLGGGYMARRRHASQGA